MTNVKEHQRYKQTRKLLVGIRLDNESKELLDWALVMVANPQDHVVALHISTSSVDECKEQKLLDDYLKVYKGLCELMKVELSGKLLSGKSVRKSIVKASKDGVTAAVILGTNKIGTFGCYLSTAKYCAKHLPSTTKIFAVHDGKVVFKRNTNSGSKEDLNPCIRKSANQVQSEFGDSDSSEINTNSANLMGKSGELIEKRNIPIRSVSDVDLKKIRVRPGWPLLRRSSLPSQKAFDSRKKSVVQCDVGLPNKTPPDTPQSSYGESSSSKSESSLGRDTSSDQTVWSDWLEEPGMPFDSNLSEFTWFSHEALSQATLQFSSGNLIGKGGCSRVYKGTFLDGRQVAVKVLKSSEQAWKDFTREANIISSSSHPNITPLLGVCIENGELMCVYDFLSRGSLEENLHGDDYNGKGILSWDVRYNVGVGIAEALHHLHTGCSRPAIHRDVKSSNILLSGYFEPQLSDFGLAIWGPNSSSPETYTDVVGTFGYLAPEYFMYGKVTDKIDVYSFGVVLLELLSGKKPINFSKAQESLVMWAKPILESGKISGVLDPKLEGNFNENQMQRMVLAATLCLKRAAGRRPNMGQILKLLKSEGTVESWRKAHVNEQVRGGSDDEDDEVYLNLSARKSHSSLALLALDDEITSCSSFEQNQTPCLADFLRGRCSIG